MSAPASRASAAASPAANTATRTSLPVPDGQGDGAADHLVGLAGVDAEAHGQLDGLVELGGGQALHQVDAPRPGVEAGRGRTACVASVYFLPCRHGLAPSCGHGRRARSLPGGCSGVVVVTGQTTLMPIDRAVPATCSLAASRSLALRSGILILAISVDLGVGDRADRSRLPGRLAALLEPGGLRAAAPASAASW